MREAPLHPQISRRIRRLAKARKIPLSHVADRAGMSRSGFWSLLNGEVSPTVRSLEMIASVLSIHVSELVEEPSEDHDDESISDDGYEP